MTEHIQEAPTTETIDNNLAEQNEDSFVDDEQEYDKEDFFIRNRSKRSNNGLFRRGE